MTLKKAAENSGDQLANTKQRLFSFFACYFYKFMEWLL